MRYLPFLFAVFLTLSCKGDRQHTSDSPKDPTFTYHRDQNTCWRLYFPDTVDVNQHYDGRILYSGILDTITTSFDDDHHRYVKVVMMVSDQPEIDFETLKTKAKDTFGAINHREIPFYSISFKKAGLHYLHGYIIDQVFLKANAKPEDSLVRMIEKGISISHKVFVKE